MVDSVPFTPAQIADLISLARADASFWELLKDRELEAERILAAAVKQGLQIDDHDLVIDPPPTIPTMGMLLDGLVTRQHGADHNLIVGFLVIPVRRQLRLELGLSV